MSTDPVPVDKIQLRYVVRPAKPDGWQVWDTELREEASWHVTRAAAVRAADCCNLKVRLT